MKNKTIPPLLKKLFILAGILIIVLISINYIIMPFYVHSEEVEVPQVIGINQNEAITLISSKNLEPVIGEVVYDEKHPKGTVIQQRPQGGRDVKVGRRVYLFISGGEPSVLVPKLKGRSLRDAKFSLERIGLKLGRIDEVVSRLPKDVIVDQEFAEGTPLKKGETVNISLSVGYGAGEIVLPYLIGKSLAEAESIIQENSLVVGKINYQPSFNLLPNTVIDQYPGSGTMLNRGDAVDLFVTQAVVIEDEY